jgi:aspartyl-tRNA(Asn)/glutamyl-tRNA(Gln) amidotransferase subunit C
MADSTPNQELLTADEVRRVATLCRVGLTDEEVERLRIEMSGLIAEVSVLQSIDTAGVEPTGHAVEEVHTVMRDDVPRETLSLDDVLANAPRREGDYFRVRAVMEGAES